LQTKKAQKEHFRLSEEERMVDAWTPGGEEGRSKRRNATASSKQATTRRYPNGGTRHPRGWHR